MSQVFFNICHLRVSAFLGGVALSQPLEKCPKVVLLVFKSAFFHISKIMLTSAKLSSKNFHVGLANIKRHSVRATLSSFTCLLVPLETSRELVYPKTSINQKYSLSSSYHLPILIITSINSSSQLCSKILRILRRFRTILYKIVRKFEKRAYRRHIGFWKKPRFPPCLVMHPFWSLKFFWTTFQTFKLFLRNDRTVVSNFRSAQVYVFSEQWVLCSWSHINS